MDKQTWISRIAVAAFLTSLLVGLAASAVAQDSLTSQEGDSVQHFELITDLSSSAGASSSAPRSAASRGRFNLSFRALGRSFDVEIEPNDLFVDGAKTTWVDDSGVVEVEPQPVFYRGRVQGASDSWVRLTLQGGTLEGMVWTPDETYFLEPAANFLGASAEGTVAYRLSDTESEWTDDSCAVEADTLRHHRHRRRLSGRSSDTFESLRELLQTSAPATGLSRLQLGIVADWELFQRHGGGTDTHMQTIVNLMDGVYQREINVKVEIVQTVVYSTSNDPFSGTSNPSSRLNEFGAFKNSNDNSPGQLLYGADLAHLFTGVDLDGSVVGIAWVGSVCETTTGAGVSQDYSSNMNSLVSLTAHEIGHNMAARHDSDVGCASGFIMNPSVVTVSNLDNLHFSTCSKSAIAVEVGNASCLDEVSPGTPTPTPTRTPTATNTPPPPYDAQYITHSVPTSMQAGQQYQVSVRMRNVGSNTWTANDLYRLGSQVGAIWGAGRVFLDGGDSIAPGQEKLFVWTVVAPTSAGNYNFRWQMLREGVTWFGDSTPNVVVNVAGSSAPPYDAQVVSQTVPSSMTAGSEYEVSVRMRNTGANTWTAADLYRLGSQVGAIWGAGRVFLGGGDSVGPGQEKLFTWTVTAPSSPGNYNFQWRMVRDGVTWFGETTPNVVVNVSGGSSGPPYDAQFILQNVPAAMTTGGEYQVSVRMRNTGSNTWTAANLYRLGSLSGATWGVGRAHLDGGESIGPNQEKTFTWTIIAPSSPGTYNFQWRMVRDGVTWFGETTTNVAVNVTASSSPPYDAQFVSQSVPTAMNAGNDYEVIVRMRNTGSNSWTAANLYRLGSQVGLTWGQGRVRLDDLESVGPGQEKAFVWTVTAPASPGSYNFRWRMVRDGVTWFGDLTPNAVVNVQ